MRYLTDKLIKFILETTEVEVIDATDDIQWVFTVPAIWKPGARQFMRNAAVKVSKCNLPRNIHYKPDMQIVMLPA